MMLDPASSGSSGRKAAARRSRMNGGSALRLDLSRHVGGSRLLQRGIEGASAGAPGESSPSVFVKGPDLVQEVGLQRVVGNRVRGPGRAVRRERRSGPGVAELVEPRAQAIRHRGAGEARGPPRSGRTVV